MGEGPPVAVSVGTVPLVAVSVGAVPVIAVSVGPAPVVVDSCDEQNAAYLYSPIVPLTGWVSALNQSDRPLPPSVGYPSLCMSSMSALALALNQALRPDSARRSWPHGRDSDSASR